MVMVKTIKEAQIIKQNNRVMTVALGIIIHPHAED
jgi:hypothetical protein